VKSRLPDVAVEEAAVAATNGDACCRRAVATTKGDGRRRYQRWVSLFARSSDSLGGDDLVQRALLVSSGLGAQALIVASRDDDLARLQAREFFFFGCKKHITQTARVDARQSERATGQIIQ